MGALEALLKIKSPTNQTPTGNGYFDKRRSSIMGSAGNLEPSELELMDEQNRVAQPVGAYSAGISRDRIRDSKMQTLSRELGLDAIDHSHKMDLVTAPKIIEGEYGVQAADASGRALADRLNISQNGQNTRQDDAQDAALERLRLQIAAAGGRQEDQQQFKVDHPTGAAPSVNPSLYANVSKAQNEYGGMLNGLSRFVGGDGGRGAYESALTAVLDKKGTLKHMPDVENLLRTAQGNTIDERIAATGVPGMQQLDPYERQYLALRLGL